MMTIPVKGSHPHVISRMVVVGEKLKVFYVCRGCEQEFVLNGHPPTALCPACRRGE